MFAIDQAQFVANIEIARIVTVPRRHIGIPASIPFAALHQHRRVRNERVTASMVKVEMRVDDEVNACGITVNRFESRADFLAWTKADLKQTGHSPAKPAGGVMLVIGMQASVEQRPPLGVLDQKDRDRHDDLAFATFHQTAELAFEVAAGQRVEGNAHRDLTSTIAGVTARLLPFSSLPIPTIRAAAPGIRSFRRILAVRVTISKG